MELPNDDTQERLAVEALVRELGYQPGDLTRNWQYGRRISLPPATPEEVEALVREVLLQSNRREILVSIIFNDWKKLNAYRQLTDLPADSPAPDWFAKDLTDLAARLNVNPVDKEQHG